MPKGKKMRKSSSAKGKALRPAHIAKGSFKELRHKVRATRAKVKERVLAGIKANRDVGSRMLDRAQALRDRLEAEARRKLDLETTLAQKDLELKELELKLEVLDRVKTEAGKTKDRTGSKRAHAEVAANTAPVSINTSNDKHKRQARVSSAAYHEEVGGYKDLLEKRLVAEDEELVLVKEQLAQLEERERALDKREDKLHAVERSLHEGACSPEAEEGIKQMRDGLEERLAILEQRNKRLDMLEAEIAKVECFIDTQHKNIEGRKRQGPARKGKGKRTGSSRKGPHKGEK